jgi:SAM-dependent methyltransferase
MGLDLVDGPNVDIVAKAPYRFPFGAGAFDVVLSGSTMEHVEDLRRWLAELVRLLKPGGLLALITHHAYRYHPHPVDCWRIMPDGMRFLFDQTGKLERYEIEMFNAHDILGAAWKVEP